MEKRKSIKIRAIIKKLSIIKKKSIKIKGGGNFM